MTTTETATIPGDEVDFIPLADLKVRDDQKYRLENKAEIKKLSESIDEVGILHNFVTDPDGFICSGTRRYGACVLLKWDRPVPRRTVSKEIADAIVLAANSTAEQPDPLHESALVQSMVDRGWLVKDIATTMGWEPKRVALLKQLQNLGPEARAAIADDNHYMREWPYEWIEQFALLGHDTQKEALETNRFQYVRDQQQLEHMLAQFFHVLGKAPWALDDATLVPTAGKDGTCITCPDQSGNKPFLFDELETGGDVKKAVCQNVSCWLAKANACAGRKITDLREKNPDSVIVVHHGAKEVLPVLKEHPTFMEHQVTICAKSEKGAVPALVLGGDGSMERKYVRKPVETATPGKPGKGPAAKKVELSDAEKDKNRKEKLLLRRRSYIIDSIKEKIREWGDRKIPDDAVVKRLVASYRVEQPLLASGDTRNLHGNAKARKELYDAAANPKKFGELVWPRLKQDMLLSISPTAKDSVEDEYEEALWISGVLELGSEKEFMTLAEAKLPSPKAPAVKQKKSAQWKSPNQKKAAAAKAAAKADKKKKPRAEDGFQPEKE